MVVESIYFKGFVLLKDPSQMMSGKFGLYKIQFFFFFLLLPVLGPLERYMTPTLESALLSSPRAGAVNYLCALDTTLRVLDTWYKSHDMNYISFLGVSLLVGIFSPSFNPGVVVPELYPSSLLAMFYALCTFNTSLLPPFPVTSFMNVIFQSKFCNLVVIKYDVKYSKQLIFVYQYLMFISLMQLTFFSKVCSSNYFLIRWKWEKLASFYCIWIVTWPDNYFSKPW